MLTMCEEYIVAQAIIEYFIHIGKLQQGLNEDMSSFACTDKVSNFV